MVSFILKKMNIKILSTLATMTLHDEIVEEHMVDIVEEPIVEAPIAAVEDQGIWVMGEHYYDDLDYFGYGEWFFENIDDATRISRRLMLEEENADYYERIDNEDYEDEEELNWIIRNANYNSRSILRLTTLAELEQQQQA